MRTSQEQHMTKFVQDHTYVYHVTNINRIDRKRIPSCAAKVDPIGRGQVSGAEHAGVDFPAQRLYDRPGSFGTSETRSVSNPTWATIRNIASQ